MKLAFSTSAVLLGALALTASAQTSKPKQSPRSLTNPGGGTFFGGGDDCAAPDVIGGTGTFGFDNTAASTGTQGQLECGAIAADVWYEWTAPSTGDATMTTCGGTSIDTKLAAFPGGGCPLDGSSLACNDDACGLQSSITFPVTSGTAYLLQVGIYQFGSVGSGTFELSIVGPPAGNADDCAAPELIGGQGSFPYDMTAATTGLEGQNESNCYDFGTSGVGTDVWFQWTADATGDATMTMCNTGAGDTKIAAYPGAGCPADGTSVACNDDTCGLLSQITFPVTNGSTYMLQVGTFPGGTQGAGAFDLTIAPPAPPANDDCSTAAVIAGQGNFAYASTFATTGTEGQAETNCYAFGTAGVGSDVWYTWTADADGLATMTMCNTGAGDTKIAAYPGAGCPLDGSSITCNDDTCGLLSEINFPVSNGSTYTLQVGTFPGGTAADGAFDISIAPITLGTSFCSASVNSTLSASLISATGSASIGADDLVLHASNAPVAQSGLFYFGANEIALPFGNGTRCVAGSTWRMPVLFEAGGSFDYDVDMGAYGGLLGALGTAKFQCWYRDPAAGGSNFNLSDGVSIPMLP